MCEPYHSVVQVEDDDGPQGPVANGGGWFGQVYGEALRSINGFGKRIGRFFHVSRMGAGHSGAIKSQGIGACREHHLIRYETAWWERQVRFDNSPWHLDDWAKQEALDAATKYSNLVSIGSVQTVRRFLEVSLAQTSSLGMYLHRYRLMFNKQGVRQVDNALRQFGMGRSGKFKFVNSLDRIENGQSALNALVGLTRQRRLLVPVWSDDKSLWVPQ